MIRFSPTTAFACLMLASCGISPRQAVLPYPDHIRAEIEVGDDVEVEMRDGSRYRLVVARFDGTTLSGGKHRLPIAEIATLAKRSWQPVRNPCDDGEPLRCSIPTAVTALSDFHERYRDEFQASCARHDFCYRYGYKTYGYARVNCDEEFLASMTTQCGSKLELDLLKRAECRLAAEHLHDSVARHGAAAFREHDSRYCEYAGPPSIVLSP